MDSGVDTDDGDDDEDDDEEDMEDEVGDEEDEKEDDVKDDDLEGDPDSKTGPESPAGVKGCDVSLTIFFKKDTNSPVSC